MDYHIFFFCGRFPNLRRFFFFCWLVCFYFVGFHDDQGWAIDEDEEDDDGDDDKGFFGVKDQDGSGLSGLPPWDGTGTPSLGDDLVASGGGGAIGNGQVRWLCRD